MMFVSMMAGKAKTRDTSSLGLIKPLVEGMVIAGRNVGAKQNEPE